MIKQFKLLQNNIHIFFKNGKSKVYPNIWLRDHIRNDENWDFRTSQRKTFTAKINLNIKAKKVEISKDGKFLKVIWPGLKNPANYSYKFLNQTSNNKDKKKIKLWKKKEIKNQIYINFKTIKTKLGFKEFLKILHKYGFAVVKNCNTNLKSVNTIAKKIGYVRNSIFGGLWTFESDNKKADSAYSQDELRPHTDSTYSYDAPGLQLLLCCKYKAKGGESIMVDGFSIANELKKKHKNIYKILCDVEVKGSYIGDGVELEAKRPILKLDSNKNLVQVSFNNYDRAPFKFSNKLTKDFYKAIKKFDLMANSKSFQWRHVLKPGELLIFDNWRVMHGRGSFKGIRKMAGCYINKEDFDSSCRKYNII